MDFSRQDVLQPFILAESSLERCNSTMEQEFPLFSNINIGESSSQEIGFRFDEMLRSFVTRLYFRS